MPTGSSSSMAQGQSVQTPWLQQSSLGPSAGQWGGNITQGSTGSNTPQSSPGQGGLQQALQGLQLFQQMKQNANPQGNVPTGDSTSKGVQTQGGIPLNVGLNEWMNVLSKAGVGQ